MKAGLFIIIHLFLVTIAGNAQIAASFTIKPATASCGVTMQFDAHLSSASQSHELITYEWDFDYDGITFDVQATGVVVEYSYSRMNVTGVGEDMTVLPYTIALRVTDNSNPAETDIATGNAALSFQNLAPIADAGGPYYSTRVNDAPVPVTLTGTYSFDPNEPCDEVVTYKWDTDGDGIFGSDDANGGLCGGSECEGYSITIIDDNWQLGSSTAISLLVIDSYGLVSDVSNTAVQILELNSIPPSIHEVTIDDLAHGDALFEFNVSHPDGNPQTFDCSFYILPGNIEVTVYDTDDDIITQIDYDGNNIVQDYSGYFDATAFSDGFGTYQLEVRVTMSDNRESVRITRPFSIDNTPPSNPTICSDPGSISGMCTNDNDPDFTWSGAWDNHSAVLDYYFYWGTDSTGESITNHTTDKGYNPDSLIVNGIYYLRINTKDEAGNEAGWNTLYTYEYFNFIYLDTDSICDNDSLLWHGNYYNTAGTYYDSLVATNGCDSIFRLDLFINPSPSSFIITGEDNVTDKQTEIYSVPGISTLTYRWDIQNGNITNQISNDSAEIQWDAIGDGYIYVIAENQYGCLSSIAILEVTIGTADIIPLYDHTKIIIYPNPVKDFIHVDYNKEFLLEIYNVQGEKILMSKQTETNVSTLTTGTYYILIKNRESKVIFISQLVKE